MFSKLRDPFSAISHFAGAAAAALGSFALIAVGADTISKLVSLIVYGASLFGMFMASGTYHAIKTSPKITEVLRKVDHSAIYLLIAGTYTPFCLVAFEGFWKWGMLAIIWGLALIGITGKVFFLHTPRWFTAGVYVLMGWLSIFAAREMLATLPASSVGWLVAGGVIYTLGAVIYITKKADFIPGLFGFHEVWHLFVIMGALAHFIAIAGMVTGGSLG